MTDKKMDSAMDYLKNRLENRNIAISHKPFKISMEYDNTVSVSSDTIFLDKPKQINAQSIKHMYGKLIHESEHVKFTNLDYNQIREKLFKFIREYYNLNRDSSISSNTFDSAFDLINIIEDYRIDVLTKHSHEGAFYIMNSTHNDIVNGKTFTTGKNALLPLLMGLNTCKYDLNAIEKEKLDKAFEIIKPVGLSLDKNICFKILPKVYEIFYPDKKITEIPVNKEVDGESFIDYKNGNESMNMRNKFKPKTNEEKKQIKEETEKAIKNAKQKQNEKQTEKTVKEMEKEIKETVKEMEKEMEKSESENNTDESNMTIAEKNIKQIEKYVTCDGRNLEFIQEIEKRRDTDKYNTVVSENKSVINKLVNELKTISINNNAFSTCEKTGKIDIKRMCRIVTNKDCRIFKKRNEKEFGNIAILLLVDCSGSMEHDEKYLTARKTSIVLHEILRQTNIKHSIIGFTADRKSILLPHDSKKKTYSVNHIIYKTFQNNSIAFNLSKIKPYSNNRDGNTIRICKEYFKGITEKKVLIVISDGNPNAYGGYEDKYAIDDTVQSQRELKKHGIKIINIGIGDSYNIPLDYANKIKVDSPNDLTKKLLVVLKRELTI